jgi:aconitase A
VDAARTLDAKDKNEEIEFERNYERFEFLNWGKTKIKKRLNFNFYNIIIIIR